MPLEKGTLYDNRIIYTPSEFAKTNLLHLQEAGTIQAKEPHTNSRRNLHSYLVFLVTRGSGAFTYDDAVYRLKAGDCVFIDCRTPYSHRSSADLWELKWVHFYGPNMQGIYQKYAERGGAPVFPARSAEQYRTLLDDIFAIASSDSYIRDMQIFEKLTALLTVLMGENYRRERILRKNSINLDLQRVKEFLDRHYAEPITLDRLAETFFINKYYLSRVFKQQFGSSPIDYVLHVRITQAKILLRFSDLSVEQICAQCGIPDPNYFARIFKKVEGCSPGEYRRRW
ncbi:MAG: AraC family transcriptional regulator [Clostridia bacterium]|nr:AraC family transcriptional regulator [Clostridia bacterium]